MTSISLSPQHFSLCRQVYGMISCFMDSPFEVFGNTVDPGNSHRFVQNHLTTLDPSCVTLYILLFQPFTVIVAIPMRSAQASNSFMQVQPDIASPCATYIFFLSWVFSDSLHTQHKVSNFEVSVTKNLMLVRPFLTIRN